MEEKDKKKWTNDNMKAKGSLQYARIAPRKVRLVADLIRGKRVQEAQRILQYTAKGAALPLLKVLNSVIDSAKNNAGSQESELYISKLTVDQGPTLKRYRARARGRASLIQKKTSHITLEVDAKEGVRAGAVVKSVTKEQATKVAKAVPATEPKAEEKTEESKEKPKFTPVRKEIQKPKKEPRLKRLFRRKTA